MLAHQIPVILGGGFDPSAIFAEMPGAWLEPRIGSMWQENTGVTPTMTVGQTIGLLLDQSQQMRLGPELVQNGDFSSATGWTQGTGWSISGGLANKSGATTGVLGQTVGITPGSAYYVTVIVTQVSGRLYISPGGYQSTPIDATGNYSFMIFVSDAASNTKINLFDSAGTGAFVGSVDSISVRQVLGNHAVQPTVANRPTLQYVNGLPLVRCDSNDFMTVYLPNLGGGVFSASGSVYFALNTGMSALHNQSIGTSYSAPIQSMDLYSAVIVPSRLSDQREAQLQTYFEKLAGLR